MLSRILHKVGPRVRELRQSRGLTQRALGDLAGLYHTTISELERGITAPSIATLTQIAAALGISLRELLDDGDAKS